MGDIAAGQKIAKVAARWMAYMFIGAALIAAYCTFFLFSCGGGQGNVQNMRVQYADAVADAEAGEYNRLSMYECAVIGVDARVIYTNSPMYKEGQSVNLHTLSTAGSVDGSAGANRFISPLAGPDGQTGILVVETSRAPEAWSAASWLGLLFPFLILASIAYCMTRLYLYIKRDVAEPADIMSCAADEILKGNYKRLAGCDSENEVGRLYRKIELLRDEFQNSSTQAKKYHEDEKMILACISHDLKTPIATIRGCAESIRDGVAKSRADIERYVGIILSKSELLTKLINDILDHTNAELDQLSLNRREVYARQFIPEVLSKLAPDIQERGLTLKVDEIPDVLLDIAPDRIFQVFQNIIGNSIKYTEKEGFIHVSFEQCANALAIEIADNGQGIAATDIPFIFDRFYRGEKARTQKEIGGSGLGLSIVRSIIERHGGKVECDSVLGQGTSMHFMLPLA